MRYVSRPGGNVSRPYWPMRPNFALRRHKPKFGKFRKKTNNPLGRKVCHVFRNRGTPPPRPCLTFPGLWGCFPVALGNAPKFRAKAHNLKFRDCGNKYPFRSQSTPCFPKSGRRSPIACSVFRTFDMFPGQDYRFLVTGSVSGQGMFPGHGGAEYTDQT